MKLQKITIFTNFSKLMTYFLLEIVQLERNQDDALIFSSNDLLIKLKDSDLLSMSIFRFSFSCKKDDFINQLQFFNYRHPGFINIKSLSITQNLILIRDVEDRQWEFSQVEYE